MSEKLHHGAKAGGTTMPQAHGGSIGQAPFVPTDEMRADVRTWAKIASQDIIAAKLGISTRTLIRHFPEELADGKFEAVAAIGGKLLAKALSGNITAMIFYLKTQGKWNSRIEIGGPDGGPIQSVDWASLLSGKSEDELAAIEPFLEQLLARFGQSAPDGNPDGVDDGPARAGEAQTGADAPGS